MNTGMSLHNGYQAAIVRGCRKYRHYLIIDSDPSGHLDRARGRYQPANQTQQFTSRDTKNISDLRGISHVGGMNQSGVVELGDGAKEEPGFRRQLGRGVWRYDRLRFLRMML